MSSDLDDLARRLAACPEFRWMRGMTGWKHPSGSAGRYRFLVGEEPWTKNPHPDAYPDLTNPLTVGGLESMVEDFRRCSDRKFVGTPWLVVAGQDSERFAFGGTKGEAIARALLEQWGAE